MADSIARLMNYPIWAHSEYETGYDEIRELVDSLAVGDVIQINDRKAPLRIDRRDEDGPLYSDDPDPFDDTTYRIKQGDGRKYGTYFHRDSSKEGIGELAVIYRDDGSISSYTEAELREMLGGTSQAGPFKITYEYADTTVRAIPTGDSGKPRVRDHSRTVGDDAEAMVEDLEKQTKKAERQFIGRYQRGQSVEEAEGLTRDVKFETRTEIAEMVAVPGPDFDDTPHGTLFFREHDVDEDARLVIPLDTLESIEPVEATDRPESTA